MTINAIIKEAQIDETGAENVAEVSIKYGDFIGVTLEFFIVAFFMFLVVKGITRLNKKKEQAPAALPARTIV
jgi:large conductance mechanosensitive channel